MQLDTGVISAAAHVFNRTAYPWGDQTLVSLKDSGLEMDGLQYDLGPVSLRSQLGGLHAVKKLKEGGDERTLADWEPRKFLVSVKPRLLFDASVSASKSVPS